MQESLGPAHRQESLHAASKCRNPYIQSSNAGIATCSLQMQGSLHTVSKCRNRYMQPPVQGGILSEARPCVRISQPVIFFFFAKNNEFYQFLQFLEAPGPGPGLGPGLGRGPGRGLGFRSPGFAFLLKTVFFHSCRSFRSFGGPGHQNWATYHHTHSAQWSPRRGVCGKCGAHVFVVGLVFV